LNIQKGNTMKKIRLYKDTWIPLFKGILYIVWFLWAVQFYQPLKETLVDEMICQKNQGPKIEMEDLLEVRIFVENLIKEAEIKDVNYSPEDYFNDLKKITQKCQFGQRSIARPMITMRLQRISLDNVNKGYYSFKDIEKQADMFENWLAERNPNLEELKELGWRKILSWLYLLYFRTMFLAGILYLARMGERKGILATILAEKKKFVLAIIVWPVFLYKYPYNIVREIRVEAELRRIKGLFKKLSLREVKLIRDIANSSNYYSWIKNYHRQHKTELQRGLFVAILATIFIHIFFAYPVKAKARSCPNKIVTLALIKAEAGQSFQEDDNSEDRDLANQYILAEKEFFEPLLFLGLFKFLKESFLSRYPEDLDRIPRNSLFGVVNRIINQTEKGIKNEYGKGFFLLFGNGIYQFSFCSQSSRSYRHL